MTDKLNVKLFRKTARLLRNLSHERHYNQSTYAEKTSCGTAACIAGHMLALSGYKLIAPRYSEPYVSYPSCFKPGGPVEVIEDVAPGLVGTSLSFDLFSGNPESDWPEEYAERWMNRRVGRKRTGERPSRIAADLLDAIADGKVR